MDISSTANICTVYNNFDFSKIILTHPESLQGGSFFTKLNINNDMLYLQTPKCISKQGVAISSAKKSYIDLVFSSDDSAFIEFMENLEKSCVEKIHEKKNSWFTNDIDVNDIENAFTATLRPYKAGKFYLLRANIAPSKNLVKLPTCFVFDESENSLTLEDIKPENDLITVLEIQGIKFTSKSFQFEIILRQALVVANKPVFQSCVIKKNVKSTENSESIVSTVSTLSTVSVASKNSNNNKIYNAVANAVDDINSEYDDNSNSNSNHNNEDISEPIGEYVSEDMVDIKCKSARDTLSEPIVDTTNESGSLSNIVSEKIGNDANKNKEINQPNLEKIESLELKEITEADLEINNNENIKLKKPNDIYYEIYCAAKEKARTARKLAFDAYLEVKKIKKIYMLDDSDSDFSNSDDNDNDNDDDDDDHDNDSNDGDSKSENEDSNES